MNYTCSKSVIRAMTLTNSLGHGIDASLHKLQTKQSGLQQCDDSGLDTWIGRVPDLENYRLSKPFEHFDCRNNRLAELAIQQDNFRIAVQNLIHQYGNHRIGVFIGTSTSGIEETERVYHRYFNATSNWSADYRYEYTHNLYAVAHFVRDLLDLTGPAQVISTACSSSAKVFASAHRYIQAGLIDAAIVGGVDSLCKTTLYGFDSLQLVSRQPCAPFDVQRDGISIGEAAGFVLLDKQVSADEDILLHGYGESSDAYHMSTPHPAGDGACLAMSEALAAAGLAPNDIDYINLHGTGTLANDSSEARAVETLFNSSIPCSSTKGWTGHTLGAAGITEAIIACLCLQHQFLPATLQLKHPCPTLNINVLMENMSYSPRYVMSNSFGFGGTNCSLIFGLQS